MTGRPLITRVVLENYKSIAYCDVKLGPLSILVGPNGAGKSNFLDALRFISEALSGPIDEAFENLGALSSVFRRSAADGNAGHLGFRIEFITSENATGVFSLRIKRHPGYTDGPGYTIEREKCSIASHDVYEARDGVLVGRSHVWNVRPIERNYLFLPYMAAHPQFSGAFTLLHDAKFYNFSPKDFNQPIQAGSVERVLRADGKNLSKVLDHINLRSPFVFERITQYLKAIYPELKSIEPIEFGGYRSVQFLLNQDVAFAPREISDGTLRSLAVLVALFQANAGADHMSLVGLEEPEAALHPAASGVLFDAFREASTSVQVLASTHSADLLDKKEIQTDCIISVEMNEGITRIGHIDDTGREALREKLYTAGELMRMKYLRPEPAVAPPESEMESILFDNLVPA